eukprot:TRINITY_DN9520_c0_g1_i1.p1 TRINITY_DN9520_c0_g1~~TRINITY_DN9520_c0_g1_i1.p1  ORF type:complete len:107 (-),score=4.15 TRINITY_DN9520_c0_g1_i1:20-340(-)
MNVQYSVDTAPQFSQTQNQVQYDNPHDKNLRLQFGFKVALMWFLCILFYTIGGISLSMSYSSGVAGPYFAGFFLTFGTMLFIYNVVYTILGSCIACKCCCGCIQVY